MARLGGLGRARRARHLNADVNIINLVDVMLVLLIIFMVTAPILQGGIQVRLPKAIAKPLDTSESMVITVDRRGAVSVEGQSVSFDAFKATFAAAVAAKHPTRILLRGDAGAGYGSIMQVMGVITTAGITNIGLVVEPVPHQ